MHVSARLPVVVVAVTSLEAAALPEDVEDRLELDPKVSEVVLVDEQLRESDDIPVEGIQYGERAVIVVSASDASSIILLWMCFCAV